MLLAGGVSRVARGLNLFLKILSALSRSFLIYIISPLTISLTDIASRKKFNIMHKLTIQPSDAFKRKKVLLNFFHAF